MENIPEEKLPQPAPAPSTETSTPIDKETILTIADGLMNIYRAHLDDKKAERETMGVLNARKLDVVRRLDRDQQWYKLAVLVLCIGALIYMGLDEKLLGVSPIIGVIIGAVLGGDAVASFLTHFRREAPDEE
jgi:hypothetical protein